MAEFWISDMGTNTELKSDDGSTMMLPRYGVWSRRKWGGKAGVVDVSDDLAGLQEKYKVPTSKVFNLRKTEGKADGA